MKTRSFNGMHNKARLIAGIGTLFLALNVHAATLKHHWALDGGAGADSVGSATFTVTGATAVDGYDGTPSGALSFDGINDRAKSGSNAIDTPPSGGVAISGWFKTQMADISTTYIINIEKIYKVTWKDGTIRPSFGATTDPILGSDTKDGQWHHFVSQNDGSTTEFYLDGELVSSVSETLVDLSTASTTSAFGSRNNGNNNYFEGLIDDIRYYEGTLSLAEVRELAGVGAPPPVIAGKGGGTYGKGSTNVVASLTAEVGDMLVVAVASNQSSAPNSSDVSTTGSAWLDSLTHISGSGTGPSAHLWYAPVTSGGSITVNYITTAEFGTATAYVLRSSQGAVAFAGSDSDNGMWAATDKTASVTNQYAFGLAKSGVYIEACSVYSAGATNVNADLSVDYSNAAQGRTVASGTFTESTGFSSVWNLTTATPQKMQLIGAAFKSVVQPAVAIDDSYMELQDTPLMVSAPGVLGNDLGVGGMTAALVSAPATGVLNLSTNGAFTYTPATGFSGDVSFTYQAENPTNASNVATVTLSVIGLDQLLDPAEKAQMENDLGIVIPLEQEVELASIVNPQTNAQWRTDAEARIEQHRKADLELRIVDQYGTPVSGADVSVKLKSHAFKFGGVCTVMDHTDAQGLLAAAGSTTADWERLTTALFNSVALNNGFKPKITGQHEYIPGFMNWAEANNLPVRGHLLIWPGGGGLEELDDPDAVSGVDYGSHMSNSGTSDYAHYDVRGAVDIYRASDRTEADKEALRAVVNAEMIEWASQWDVYEWDVANEVRGNTLLQEILGFEEMAEWFKLAETNKVDPNCGLFINEFAMISAMHGDNEITYEKYRDKYYERIDKILADNGPLTGIGFQCHFKRGLTPAELVYSRLDDFATRYPNASLAGTEFEMRDVYEESGAPRMLYGEQDRARMTEEVLTTYFSHDQATGLNAWNYMWSSTDDDPANSPAAMCHYDGTVKLNGLAWYYLHRIRYQTAEARVADGSGLAQVRGFKGDYDITVSYNDVDYPVEVALQSNQTVTITLDGAAVPPINLYDDWTLASGLVGSDTNMLANPDGDAFDNLLEYAFGGAPTNPLVAGHAPDFHALEEGGSNYIDYVYTRRTDAVARGLTYSLELSTNLISNVWANFGYTVTGSNEVDSAYQTITNRVPVADEEKQFIRLQIKFQ